MLRIFQGNVLMLVSVLDLERAVRPVAEPVLEPVVVLAFWN